MKSIRQPLQKLFLIFSLAAILLPAWANDPADMWKAMLIKEGREELKKLQAKNQLNDRRGLSHQNSYIVVVGDNDEYPDAEFLKQRRGKNSQGEETSGLYPLNATELATLNQKLSDQNKTSTIKAYVLVVHYMPLEFFNIIPDNQSIGEFFSGKKTEMVSAIAQPASNLAREIVTGITAPELAKATVPTLYCGFVHFKVFKNATEEFSQWVYYPRRSEKIDFDQNYARMLGSFIQSANWSGRPAGKVQKLVEVITKNNAEYDKVKGPLATIMSINDPFQMAKALEGISGNGFAAFDIQQKIHVLKVLSSGAIPDSWEVMINNVIATTTAPNDAKELIIALGKGNDKLPETIEMEVQLQDGAYTSSKPNPKKGWCLLQCITNETGDAALGVFGGDNYKKFIQSLINLCRLSPDFETKVEELANITDNDLIASKTIFYNYNSFWSKLGSTLNTFPDPKIDRTTNYITNCQLETSTELFFSYLFPNTDLTSDKLDPFEPIVFVNKSNLGMLADLDGTENIFVAPAIVLKYADDKAWSQTTTDVSMAVIDAASLAVGYGEIKAGVTGLRKAWTLLDMANSGINLTLNASGLSQNPQVKKILDAYNLVTGGVAITRMGAGGIRNVYTYIKGRQILRGDDVKALIQALDDGGEDALKSFSNDDLQSIEGLVRKVKGDATARGLTNLEAQAERILSRITNFHDRWISELFKNNTNLSAYKQSLATGGRKMALYLSIEEEAMIKYYTTNPGYKDFNKALRGEIPMTQEFLSQERLLNRALDKLPISAYNGEHTLLYRIEDLPNDLINSLYKEGEVVDFKSFVSATYSREAAKEAMLVRPHSFLLRIQGKDGRLIESISTLPSEKEILFKSNSRFRVKKVDVETHPLVQDGVYPEADEIGKFTGIYSNYDQIRVVTLEQL